MEKFYLKHPTKSDFWANMGEVAVGADFFWTFAKIKEFLRSREKEGQHNLTPEYVNALIQKIDFFDTHTKKTETSSYKYYHFRSKLKKFFEVSIEAPMSFGADSSKFAFEFTDIQKQIVDPLQLCIEYGEKLKDIEKELKSTVLVFPYWEGKEEKKEILEVYAKNPFNKVKIWNKALTNKSFAIVPFGSQARLFSSKAYAIFQDNGECGYYAHKAGSAVALSEATLFDTELLAKRQQAKLFKGTEHTGIVEVEIQFKKIVARPSEPQDIDKLQAYHDKEAITQFFSQHNTETLRAELEKLELQNKELRAQQGIDTENTTAEPVVKKKHKI